MTTNRSTETVAIIGASDKEGRYAKRAQELLIEKGHQVIPINPVKSSVGGMDAYASLSDVPTDLHIDTVTLYVRPEILESHLPSILDRGVRRVIFNPGTESELQQAELEQAGIHCEQACTLVLLRTEQF